MQIQKMQDDSKPLILKTDEKPTFFNKEAAIGFFIDPILGTSVGGVVGRERMKQEQVFGKVVSKPSIFNKSAILGGLIGSSLAAIGGFFAISSKIMAPLAPEAATLAVSTAATISAMPAIMTTLLAVAAIGFIAGALIGGYYGKKTEEKEYSQALEQQRAREQQKTFEPTIHKSAEREYNHEVKTNHAASLAEERERAASQQRHV